MKTIIFHLLRTFRWAIVPASKVLSALMVVVLILATFSNSTTEPPNLVLTFILAIMFGMVSWYYDALLKKLEPQKKTNQEWS